MLQLTQRLQSVNQVPQNYQFEFEFKFQKGINTSMFSFRCLKITFKNDLD